MALVNASLSALPAHLQPSFLSLPTILTFPPHHLPPAPFLPTTYAHSLPTSPALCVCGVAQAAWLGAGGGGMAPLPHLQAAASVWQAVALAGVASAISVAINGDIINGNGNISGGSSSSSVISGNHHNVISNGGNIVMCDDSIVRVSNDNQSGRWGVAISDDSGVWRGNRQNTACLPAAACLPAFLSVVVTCVCVACAHFASRARTCLHAFCLPPASQCRY